VIEFENVVQSLLKSRGLPVRSADDGGGGGGPSTLFHKTSW
jgi:hypothetical protein